MIPQIALMLWLLLGMTWMNIFHSLVIPFLGDAALTLGKLIADQELLSFDKSNDIALEMVLLAVGALGAFYIKGAAAEPTIDAGIGDAFIGAVLLYLRYERKRAVVAGTRPASISAWNGIVQLILGAAAIIWTVKAF